MLILPPKLIWLSGINLLLDLKFIVSISFAISSLSRSSSFKLSLSSSATSSSLILSLLVDEARSDSLIIEFES